LKADRELQLFAQSFSPVGRNHYRDMLGLQSAMENPVPTPGLLTVITKICKIMPSLPRSSAGASTEEEEMTLPSLLGRTVDAPEPE
jgi:hypothetical protein